MQKFIFYSIFLLPVLFISQTFAQTAPKTVSVNSENEVKQVIDAYYTAWNQHDAKKMASYYASDGDLRSPWNEFGKDRKEVEAIFASEHAKQLKDAHIDHSVKSIRMIKPNIAFVDVESTIAGMEAADKNQYSTLHHHVVYVLVNRDGKWQILIGRPF